MPQHFHIIIADDDNDDQSIITDVIRDISSQIKCTSVYDGLPLFECLQKKGLYANLKGTPNLIILDLNMPLMNGMEVLCKIKKMAQFKDIPVFILSTLRTIDKVDQSIMLGAVDYFSKPNQIGEYRTIIRQILDVTIYADEHTKN